MALLASGLQSTAAVQRSTRDTSAQLSSQQAGRRNVFGRSVKPIQRKLASLPKAMVSKDEDSSRQGRLLRDALEFSKPQSEDAAKEHAPGPAAGAQVDYKAGELLGGKYTVVEVLGRGKAGVTYKAASPTGEAVAIKALSLRSMADWRQLELFEKEADALRSLKHAGIPAFIDYFEVDSDGDRAYFLVQELIEGKSLAQMVEAGWQPAQKEVERIADELLTTFSYLQKEQVTHRDVKPENIILQGGKPGGKVFLVDFGGIQQGDKDIADSEVMDTGTLVGTYGYMAPEQLRGSARPASDLFALGATLLYLLSGEPPSSFPQRRLNIDFSRVNMSSRLDGLLEGLLQPAWEDRLTASQAKAVLAGQGPTSQQQQRQQQQQEQESRARNPFSQDGWEGKRAGFSSDAQANNDEQESASTSGRHEREPQGVGINNVLLALAAAYVLPGPLFPLVALTLPFWLSGKSRRRSNRSPPKSGDAETSTSDSDWMSGTQHRQQSGFGFSDGPAATSDSRASETEMTPEEQEEHRRHRKQQQMAAFQQQQMLFNMVRMMGGGMMGGYRGGFGGPFGMRGGFRRGPFMF